jgi:hypothetical protein
MESVNDVSCSSLECTSCSLSAPIWQDVLAQAVTGEQLAAMNYTSLSEICDDPAEVADALEHAAGERGHAASFAAEGRKMGVDVANNSMQCIGSGSAKHSCAASQSATLSAV